MTFEWPDIISTSLASLALLVSFLQWRTQRHKDKIDTRPRLKPIHFWDERTRVVQVENKGLGQAIITNITLHYEGKNKKEIPLKPYSYDDNDPTNLFHNQPGFYTSYAFNGEIVLLNPDETFRIISFKSHEQHGHEGVLETLNILKIITIEVTYKTTYSNKVHSFKIPAYNHCDYDIY